jgi:CheY-like chemotaxis protein
MDVGGNSWVEVLRATKRGEGPVAGASGTSGEATVSETDAHLEIVLPDDEDDEGGVPDRRERSQILLVEDDARFAELVERILADGAPEFEILHAPRITAALARLARHPIRLILTDLNLPDSTGAGTVRHLNRAAPNVPLVVLSGNSDLEVTLECIRDGAEEFVVKRALDAPGLIRLIRITLERRHRLALHWAAEYDDPITGVKGPAALEAVGRQLLKLADRTGIPISVLSLQSKVREGPVVGEGQRIIEVAAILRSTLRRCDVIARVEPTELAVILVGDRPGSHLATDRLAGVLVPVAGGQLQMGIASYDRHHPESIQLLLARARNALRPVEA